MYLYNYKYLTLFVNAYLQSYLHLITKGKFFLKRFFFTFKCRFKSSKLYIFLLLWSYVKSVFSSNIVYTLFNKKKTKNKFRKSTYKDVTIYISMNPKHCYYWYTNVVSMTVIDNYVNSNSLYDMFFNSNVVNSNNQNIPTSYNTISFGISLSSFFKLCNHYVISPLEIKTLLQSYLGKSYLKVDFTSDFNNFNFFLFFLHNLYPKYLYPFVNL